MDSASFRLLTAHHHREGFLDGFYFPVWKSGGIEMNYIKIIGIWITASVFALAPAKATGMPMTSLWLWGAFPISLIIVLWVCYSTEKKMDEAQARAKASGGRIRWC